MREWFSQLVEFPGRTVHFQSDQVRDFKTFCEQRADVIEMREEPLGVHISFATENFVTVDAEP